MRKKWREGSEWKTPLLGTRKRKGDARSLCDVQQFGSKGLLSNLMEVKD